MINEITEDSIVPVEVVDGDKTVVTPGIIIDVLDDFAVGITGITTLLRNFGEILNSDRFGVKVEGQEARIDNTDTGVIQGEYVGISAEFGDSTITNDGFVSGTYAAIDIAASYAVNVTNRGTLESDFNGIIVGDGTITTRINNYGTVEAAEAGSIGISVEDGAFATRIYNAGQLLAQAFGIRNDGAASNIHNQGDITANIGIETNGDARIVNDGNIIGTLAALVVEGSLANANVTNRGTMTGDLFFEGGSDRLNNTGTITGDIVTGDGRDKINNNGAIIGEISLGDERDLYNGNNALVGAVVNGGAGRDDLRGSDFADILSGGADRDVIRASGGDDQLIGGGDQDVLTGGAGADVFIYNDAADSGEVFDVITDFVSGEDKLDLTTLSAGVFAFASGGFTGGGVASVFGDLKANTNNFINIDIDGDGFRDMLVLLQRAGAVTADDFIL